MFGPIVRVVTRPSRCDIARQPRAERGRDASKEHLVAQSVAIDQARRVREQHSIGDRRVRESRISYREREPIVHVIVERELALLLKLHQSHGQKSLRHRGEQKDRVGRRRSTLGDVGEAVPLLPDNLSSLHDRRGETRHMRGGHVFPKKGVHRVMVHVPRGHGFVGARVGGVGRRRTTRGEEQESHRDGGRAQHPIVLSHNVRH